MLLIFNPIARPESEFGNASSACLLQSNSTENIILAPVSKVCPKSYITAQITFLFLIQLFILQVVQSHHDKDPLNIIFEPHCSS